MSNNSIADISAIGNLVNLTRLELNENDISDVSSLQTLVNAESIVIESNFNLTCDSLMVLEMALGFEPIHVECYA